MQAIRPHCSAFCGLKPTTKQGKSIGQRPQSNSNDRGDFFRPPIGQFNGYFSNTLRPTDGYSNPRKKHKNVLTVGRTHRLPLSVSLPPRVELVEFSTVALQVNGHQLFVSHSHFCAVRSKHRKILITDCKRKQTYLLLVFLTPSAILYFKSIRISLFLPRSLALSALQRNTTHSKFPGRSVTQLNINHLTTVTHARTG